MKISFACEQGKNHISSGKLCEDSVEIYNNNCIMVAALSDGAGSKPLARDCSQLLAVKTVEFFCKDQSRITFFDSIEYLSFINSELSEQGLNTENAGATLLFIAADEAEFVCGHIGDGVIIVKERSSQFRILSEPENGRYINETYFLPGENVSEHFRLCSGSIDCVECIIMTSDGISDKLYDLETGVPAPVCNKLHEISELLSEPEACEVLSDNLRNLFSKYTADDMSIIVISK